MGDFSDSIATVFTFGETWRHVNTIQWQHLGAPTTLALSPLSRERGLRSVSHSVFHNVGETSCNWMLDPGRWPANGPMRSTCVAGSCLMTDASSCRKICMKAH